MRSDSSDARASTAAAAAFRASPIAAGIVSLGGGDDQRWVDVNLAMCELLGREQSEVAALPVEEVLPGARALLAQSAAPREPASAELQVVNAGGRECPVTAVTIGLHDDASEPQAVIQLVQTPGRREMERLLRESERRVQDLVDNVGALIYIKAIDGRFLLVNRHFEEMFGISRHDAPMCTNHDFFPAEIAKVYTENDQAVLESGMPLQFEEPRDAGGAWLSLKFPLRDEDGRIYAVGGISTDISSRQRAEAAIRQAKDEAERANRAKSEFLSRMSHELRTPLNAILGFGQLLQMDGLQPRSRESVDRIVKAGRHLLALINEVLELSRIEAGRQPSTLAAVHVCEPLQEAVELVRPLALERSVELIQDYHHGLYQYVHADRQHLKQVILNVLSNAIKYNRIGGTVQIAFRRVSQERLRLLISDTGYGIEQSEFERVFLPFERLRTERAGVEGTGLGLALSRSLIEAMGGTVGIERSAPGKGTTFYVDLSLTDERENAEEMQAAGSELAAAGMELPACTVVYIEDNLSNLDLVQGLFTRVGKVRLIPAVQGTLGIELAVRHLPDVILLDLDLPDIDGEEVLARLSQDERTRQIPVIILSADATPTQIAALKARGAADYVTKPIDVPLFLEGIRRALAAEPANGDRTN